MDVYFVTTARARRFPYVKTYKEKTYGVRFIHAGWLWWHVSLTFGN